MSSDGRGAPNFLKNPVLQPKRATFLRSAIKLFPFAPFLKSIFSGVCRGRLQWGSSARFRSNDVGMSYIAELVAEQKAIDYKHFSSKSEAKNWLLNG